MSFDAFADFRMTGQSAIVTGGAQNIGAAIARSFAGAGARVMIADETGSEVIATGCDVTSSGFAGRRAAGVRFSGLLLGQGRAESSDARVGPQLRTAGTRQYDIDRRGVDTGLCGRRARRAGSAGAGTPR